MDKTFNIPDPREATINSLDYIQSNKQTTTSADIQDVLSKGFLRPNEIGFAAVETVSGNIEGFAAKQLRAAVTDDGIGPSPWDWIRPF